MAEAPENQPLENTEADKINDDNIDSAPEKREETSTEGETKDSEPASSQLASEAKDTTESDEPSNDGETPPVVEANTPDESESSDENLEDPSAQTKSEFSEDPANSEDSPSEVAKSSEDTATNAEKPEEVQEDNESEIVAATDAEEEELSTDETMASSEDENLGSETLEVKEEATHSDTSQTSDDSSEVVPESDSTSEESRNTISETSSESDTDTEAEESDEKEEEEAAPPDYSQFSREELAREMERLAKGEDVKSISDQVRELKLHFDEHEEAEREKALQQFISEGGDKEGFEYRPDEYYTLFYAAYDNIRERRTQHRATREKNRQQNLLAKEEILNRLRDFVDSEETQVSIGKLKEIQQEWKSIGEVPSSQNRSLWANYNALLDRFYDNRSIYFELKELDRRKNLEAKTLLAARAEQLVEEPDIKKAAQELDELHEEYKHIGPVPRDEQEALWQRFKAASDKIHDRRREDVEAFKEQLKLNLVEKQKLVEEVKEFTSFESDSIKEWNKKTKEIQQIQKRWDAAGSMPRSQAKEVNKQFWSYFKEFFAHKGEFFKRLDAQREGNLKQKEELVAKAESLKDSDDWKSTSNELKRLQREWKDIGPVPEKFRETVYQRFKAACDEFFNRRRNNSQEAEVEYQKNLKTKEEICEKIEKLAQEKSSDLEAFSELTQQYSNTGFVPRGAIKSIGERYQSAVNQFLENAEKLDETQKKEVQVGIELGAMKGGPGANRRIHQKEGNIRRQISRLEDDISVWKNNITFFASSKQADKLVADVERKIEKASAELEQLKSQLDVLRNLKDN